MVVRFSFVSKARLHPVASYFAERLLRAECGCDSRALQRPFASADRHGSGRTGLVDDPTPMPEPDRVHAEKTLPNFGTRPKSSQTYVTAATNSRIASEQM